MAEQTQPPDVVTSVGELISGDNNGIPTQWRKTTVALPSAPVDGQEVYLHVDGPSDDDVIWHLKYRSGSASAYKWEFVGGPPLTTESTTAFVSSSSTSYTSAPSGGTLPALTMPSVAGDYDIEVFGQPMNDTTAAYIYLSYKIGAAAAVDADGIQSRADSAQAAAKSLTMRRRKLAVAASVVLQMQMRVSAGTGFPDNNGGPLGLRVWPVRLG